MTDARLIDDLKREIGVLKAAVQQNERELEERSHSLKEANRALSAAMDHREIEKRSIEATIIESVRNYILPHLDRIIDSKTDTDRRTCIDIIKSNLKNLVRPNSHSLNSKYLGLTPKEIQVADLIRHGKSSKEIAASLNISISSISFYRYSIRKKLGLINKKANLRTHLVSIHNSLSSPSNH